VVGNRVEAEHSHIARCGTAVALERFDGRCLTGAVRSEDDEDLAWFRRQVEIVDGGRCVEGPIAHRKAADLDCRHGVAGYFEQE
jgi:hypothetical protein